MQGMQSVEGSLKLSSLTSRSPIASHSPSESTTAESASSALLVCHVPAAVVSSSLPPDHETRTSSESLERLLALDIDLGQLPCETHSKGFTCVFFGATRGRTV